MTQDTQPPKTSAPNFKDFAHIGPGTPAGALLRQFWQPVMLSSDLAISRAKRVEIFGEFFTAYRGADGRAHFVDDRCPHRLTALSLGRVEGDEIRCFYHGWGFDPSGACVRQPAEKNPERKHRIRIRSFPVHEYLGFVFAYLGTGEPPAFPLFPEVDVERDRVQYGARNVPCNFFQRLENDLDEVHLHFVHSVSNEEIGLEEMPEIIVSEAEFGILRKGVRSDKEANVTRTGRIFFPNCTMVITPSRGSRQEWVLHLAWRVPVNDTKMISFMIDARKNAGGSLNKMPEIDPHPDFLTQEILEGRLRIQDVDSKYPGLFNVQDNVALAGQGEIVDRAKERLGESDKGIIFMRNLWEREMRALHEGRPLKAWTRPPQSLIEDGSREVQLASS